MKQDATQHRGHGAGRYARKLIARVQPIARAIREYEEILDTHLGDPETALDPNIVAGEITLDDWTDPHERIICLVRIAAHDGNRLETETPRFGEFMLSVTARTAPGSTDTVVFLTRLHARFHPDVERAARTIVDPDNTGQVDEVRELVSGLAVAA